MMRLPCGELVSNRSRSEIVPPQLKRDSPRRRHRSGIWSARAPPRRSFTAEQKAALLRRHHVDKVPVSQICEENDLQHSLFYYWQKQLFENAVSAHQPPVAPRFEGTRGQGRGPREAGRQEGRGHRLGDRGAREAKKTLGEP